jgi:hypothetical protein
MSEEYDQENEDLNPEIMSPQDENPRQIRQIEPMSQNRDYSNYQIYIRDSFYSVMLETIQNFVNEKISMINATYPTADDNQKFSILEGLLNIRPANRQRSQGTDLIFDAIDKAVTRYAYMYVDSPAYFDNKISNFDLIQILQTLYHYFPYINAFQQYIDFYVGEVEQYQSQYNNTREQNPTNPINPRIVETYYPLENPTGTGKPTSTLHAIIIHKPIIMSHAHKIVADITKTNKKRYMRETAKSYRFRIVPKTKFKSFYSKKINPTITLVFGNLK